MTPDALLPHATHALWVLALTLGPVVVPALVVGLIVGVLQAATSVNEATLAFVPKVLAAMLSLGLMGALIVRLLTDFFAETFELVAGVGQ